MTESRRGYFLMYGEPKPEAEQHEHNELRTFVETEALTDGQMNLLVACLKLAPEAKTVAITAEPVEWLRESTDTLSRALLINHERQCRDVLMRDLRTPMHPPGVAESVDLGVCLLRVYRDTLLHIRQEQYSANFTAKSKGLEILAPDWFQSERFLMESELTDPDDRWSVALAFWTNYPSYRHDCEPPARLRELEEAHRAAIGVLMAIAENVGVESRKLDEAGMICRDLAKFKPWLFYGDPYDSDNWTWPECVRGKLLDLGADIRQAINAASSIMDELAVRGCFSFGAEKLQKLNPKDFTDWLLPKKIRDVFGLTSQQGWTEFANKGRKEGTIISHPSKGPKEVKIHRTIFEKFGLPFPSN